MVGLLVSAAFLMALFLFGGLPVWVRHACELG
jgi:hypothetical protein